MATVIGAKVVGAPFDNRVEVVRVKYDFAVDGGAIGDKTLITVDGNVLVRCVGVDVEAAFTSGGSATVSAGKTTSGAEYLSASAVANFTLAALVPSASNAFIKYADGAIVNMKIATAALTAGKAEFIFEICQA